MARKFLVSLDLTKNELLNARIQNLPSSSKPTNPVTGQIYYDTTDNFLYFWNGTTWLRASGDFGIGGQTTSLTFGNTKSDGTSSSVARADHVHELPDIIGESGQIGISKDPTSGDATFTLVDTAVTPGTYGSQTQIPTFTVDSKGRLTAASQVDVATQLKVTDDNATEIQIDLLTEGLSVNGGEGIDVSVSGNTLTVAAEDATHTNKGVANFPATDFEVSSGSVTINAERIQDIVSSQIVAGEGIDVTYDDANGTLTVDAEIATTTNRGVASFATADFSVSNGEVTVKNVNLGTQTTGDYVAGIQGTTNEIAVTNSGGEGSTVTIGLPDDVTIGNNLTVNGNLNVLGSINSVNTTQVNIEDNKINLNSNMSESAEPTVDAGLIIHRGAQNDALLTWNETSDQWEVGLDTGRQYSIARKFAADLNTGDYVTISGGGTVFTVNHGLNTRDISIQVYESAAEWNNVEVDTERTTANTVTVRFASAPAAGAYRVVITG
jgi:hypothetical protein